MDCIFCKIGGKEVSAQIVAESPHFYAMLDNHPSAPGHTLIIPKSHSENLLDLARGEEWLTFTQRVARGVVKAMQADGFNLVLNNGAAAGQMVFHTHFHILPRKENDQMVVQIGKKQDSPDLKELGDRIRKYL